jgi:methionyl-tRNA formyltransferase
MQRAIVFAYHDVGYRCLSVLLEHGIEVALVVTHEDDPTENIWFADVASLAKHHELPTITPADPNSPEIVAQIEALAPDWIFSFYYRHVLGPELLRIPKRGAFNMHGSLLPKYRGRVPINWAVLHGETETGATLHEMVEKPDAGRVVDQQAVPILPDDTARDVFAKVTIAAELVLDRSLPALVNGTALLCEQDLMKGKYYGGRKPEDGRIDWQQPAQTIHNLVRALAPPYPGAFSDIRIGRLRLLRTRLLEESPSDMMAAPALYTTPEEMFIISTDRKLLQILSAELNGLTLDAHGWRAVRGSFPFFLGDVN